MEKLKEVFVKLWNSYRDWLGNKVWYKNWKVWLSVILVLGIAGAFAEDDEKIEAEEPAEEEVSQETQELIDEIEAVEEVEEEPKQRSEDDLIREFDELGKKTFGDDYVKTTVLWDIEEAVYHEDGSYDPDESVIDVINVETFLTSSQIRGFLLSSTNLLEEFQEFDFNRIHISGDGKFTDQYGKETEQNATYLEITKETMDKINFDNFNWKNLPNVADNFWMHQSMGTKGLE